MSQDSAFYRDHVALKEQHTTSNSLLNCEQLVASRRQAFGDSRSSFGTESVASSLGFSPSQYSFGNRSLPTLAQTSSSLRSSASWTSLTSSSSIIGLPFEPQHPRPRSRPQPYTAAEAMYAAGRTERLWSPFPAGRHGSQTPLRPALRTAAAEGHADGVRWINGGWRLGTTAGPRPPARRWGPDGYLAARAGQRGSRKVLVADDDDEF